MPALDIVEKSTNPYAKQFLVTATLIKSPTLSCETLALCWKRGTLSTS